MVESITNTTNVCNTTVNANQVFFINGGSSNRCTVTASGSSTVSTNMSCFAENSTMNNVTNNLAQTAQQSAKSIQQQFGFLTFSEAINISQSYINLSNVIQTTFYNSCITSISNNQLAVIDCENSNDFTVDVDFNQTNIVTQDCIFNNAAVTQIKNDITQFVEQKAYSEIENYVAGVLMAFTLVLFAFAAVIFLVLILISPKKKTTDQNASVLEQQTGVDLQITDVRKNIENVIKSNSGTVTAQ